MPLKIIVVGAGIGGLTAAVALRQASHEVEVGEHIGVNLYQWNMEYIPA